MTKTSIVVDGSAPVREIVSFPMEAQDGKAALDKPGHRDPILIHRTAGEPAPQS